MKLSKKTITNILAPLVTFLLLFGFWEWAVSHYQLPKWLLPAPSGIIQSMVVNFNDFWPHILITFETVLIGFLIAVPVGILLATLITSNKIISAALSPFVIFLVTTPLVTLIPIMMLFMGFGQKVRIIGVVIQAFSIVNMNTVTGILNVPIIRHELMQTMGSNKFQSLRHMIYPTAIVDIFTGVRLSAIFATTACISAEYVAGNHGLGSQIIKYSQFLKTTESFACIFYVTIIGLFMYGFVAFLQKKVIYWKI
ncbi:MAG TPA: ABC transporter permease [Clostridiales bacterium]|jgi:NitT/TauT family transport system permease protein|nr:ABC transporter permease [Clostridiales bacterium]